MGTHAAAVALYPNLAYKPDVDFEPIGLVAEQPELLAVRKDLPPNTLREFAAYAKANESKLNMAHAGIGSVSHVGCLLLNAAIGINPTMVPFTGTGPAMNALIAGQLDYVCDPILGPLPHVRTGTVKALAIATSKRNSLLPDVPTSAEAGLPQFDAAPFYAVFAPNRTPEPIIDRLADALNKGLNKDVARKRLLDLGAEIPEPNRRGPEALEAVAKSEIARLTPIIQAANFPMIALSMVMLDVFAECAPQGGRWRHAGVKTVPSLIPVLLKPWRKALVTSNGSRGPWSTHCAKPAASTPEPGSRLR
jgi:tripartite-type tricarboxylate transporter receptor subunit TctC